MEYLTVPLDSQHKKAEFDCGNALLTSYFKNQANQDVKRQLSRCFVIANEENYVKGYYTISSSSIDKEHIPDKIKNKLPKSYLDIPVILLGRLARDIKYKGGNIGEVLLMDALKRCYDVSLNLGCMAVVVDPIDEKAKAFYLKYGFVLLPDSNRMFISMATIIELFK
jgi:predicted GNAT family N-acyltransferase